MQNDKLKLHLHSNCLILLGFTAVLGLLITITADAIVWYRMLLAAGFLFFLYLRKNLRIPLKSLLTLTFVDS
jgi:hypothetical protein